MNAFSTLRSRRLAFGLIAVALVVVAGLGINLVQQRLRGETQAVPPAVAGSICSNSAVQADFAVVPILDPKVSAQRIAVPAGEPAVVAIVNGEPITAVALESRVNIEYSLNQRTLSQLTPNDSASLRASLQRTKDQLRGPMLNTMIDEVLYLQQASRLGVSVSAAQVKATTQHELLTLENFPAATPGYNTFHAYLCVNNLTTDTYATNPLVLAATKKGLTMSALNQKVIAGLPPSEQRDQVASQQAIVAYKQHLRQTAHLQVFISV